MGLGPQGPLGWAVLLFGNRMTAYLIALAIVGLIIITVSGV